MNNYEIMYIIKPDLEKKNILKNQEQINSFFDKKVVDTKKPELKDLAYKIKQYKQGYYVWLTVKDEAEKIQEFQRLINLNENVLRYIVLKLENPKQNTRK